MEENNCSICKYGYYLLKGKCVNRINSYDGFAYVDPPKPDETDGKKVDEGDDAGD